MKRFYKKATAVKAGNGLYEIHLDGRGVKLPGTQDTLQVALKSVAEALAQEWDAQEGAIVPDSMPIMQIVSTSLDRVAKQRPAMEAQILRYVDTDLLYYRADEPADLVELQSQAWDPILHWFETELDITLDRTTQLVALVQPPRLHAYIEGYCSGLSQDMFTVFQIVVPLCGSVLTAMRFMMGALTPQQVLEVCRVEERHKDGIYNADKYGQDPSIEKADAAMLAELEACQRYISFFQ